MFAKLLLSGQRPRDPVSKQSDPAKRPQAKRASSELPTHNGASVCLFICSHQKGVFMCVCSCTVFQRLNIAFLYHKTHWSSDLRCWFKTVRNCMGSSPTAGRSHFSDWLFSHLLTILGYRRPNECNQGARALTCRWCYAINKYAWTN